MRQVQAADIPGGDVDTEGVVASAQAVRDASERLRTAGDQVVGIWAGLPHCYDAPEAPTLYTAMHPVARDTVTYAEAAGAAATALTRYAEDVASVQARMRVTAPLVEALAGRIAATPVWRSDTSITSQNATLQRQVRGAQEDLDTAADVCTAAIRGALTGGGRAGTPWLTAPGPISPGALQQHLSALDDPRGNPFFFVGKTPADVNAWWRGLSPGAQRQLITERPDLVGNRDGIPAAARDEANRIRLATAREEIEKEIRDLERRLAGDPRFSPHNPDYTGPQLPVGPLLWDEAGQMLLRGAHARLGVLESIEETISRTKGADRQLLTLRLHTNFPRAAVAVGNVDTATHLAALVPGTGTTVKEELGKLDHKAEQLLAVTHALAPNTKSNIAVISWLDYQAPPELINATSPRRAIHGGVTLAGFSEGISLASEITAPRITLYGHSYGALVVNEAASTKGSHVSAVVVAGAPGIGHQSAETAERYSIIADNDPIRHYPVIFGESTLGTYPYDAATAWGRGAWETLGSSGETREDGSETSDVSGHSQYLNDGTTSQTQVARVIVDQKKGNS